MFRKLHLFLGLLVGLPLLAWSASGFYLALPPGAVSGEPYQGIEAAKVVLSPAEALEIARKSLGDEAKVTALTLEQRGGKARYSVFSSQGSLLVDASSGETSKPPPTSRLNRMVRHAHFYNFAGAWSTTLLLVFSALALLSTLSGLWLAAVWLRRRVL